MCLGASVCCAHTKLKWSYSMMLFFCLAAHPAPSHSTTRANVSICSWRLDAEEEAERTLASHRAVRRAGTRRTEWHRFIRLLSGPSAPPFHRHKLQKQRIVARGYKRQAMNNCCRTRLHFEHRLKTNSTSPNQGKLSICIMSLILESDVCTPTQNLKWFNQNKFVL